MNIPTNTGRRFFGALIPVFVIASNIAWGGPVYTIQDGGVPRQFEIADDEVSLFRKGGGLAKDVKSNLGDALVVKDFGNRVVVRFPKADWRKVVGPRVVAGADYEPVAYEQGMSRTDAARRIVTPQVLALGANEAELLRVSGATGAKSTGVDGYVMLTFASASDALVGTEKLRKGGVKAEPQLRRQVSKRAVPNDLSFDQQWHLQNTGQGSGVPGTDINPLLAWDYDDFGLLNGFSGNGVTIAIVDDCLEVGQVDLSPNALPLGVGGPHHDFNGDDDNPSPGFGDAHGTSCAGVAAGRGNNGFGISGSGPRATLLGLRLISGPFTDADELSAFTWTGGSVPATIDISSNSWGPFDDVRLEGPGILSLSGLRTSAQSGRGGKGVVFCWAGGNGRYNDDNVNMDGYANSRYVIAVGAVGNNARQSGYSESGSPLLVCAPSDGGSLGIFTTDVTGAGGYDPSDYTNSFGGTSSAAPLVAGVASLVLEANPALGYRDVMEILASTAGKVDQTHTGWALNGAGFTFNHSYGGGMVDATAAVVRAVDWVNLAAEAVDERILSSPAVPVGIPDGVPAGISRDFNFTGSLLRVEHVEVQLDIAHAHRSDLQITITSPSGHVSRLIEKRSRPVNGNSDVDYSDGNLGWIFSTTQHWGEAASGTWRVNINDTEPGTAGTLRKARVRLFGTPASSSSRITFEKKIENVSEVATNAPVLVRRLGSLAAAASVDYYTGNRSTATAATVGIIPPDGDFTSVSGTVQFAAGEQFKTITIPIHDDPDLEGDERFYVVLTNPLGASFGGITVQTIEIDDDEGNAVTVTATDFTASERNLATEPADNGVFTIRRKLAEPFPLVVKYTLTQPSAVPAPGDVNYATHILDYLELPLTATIPANASSVDVIIQPRNDRFSEGTEIVELSLTPDAAYNLGLPNASLVNIVDNDLVPVSVTSSVASIVESSPNNVDFTITRDTPQLDAPLNISLEPSGSAEPGVDYDPPFPAFLTIPAGTASVTVSIKPNDNNFFNPLKTVILGVSQGQEYKEGFFRTVEVRIFDDEPVPDAIRPTVTIATPTKAQRIDHPALVTATGTATDNPDSLGNTNAAQVRFRLNGGAWNVATLTNNDWSADITTLAAFGDNLIDVYSIDEAGNESKISSQGFTYVKIRNLTMTVTGPGTVSADFVGTKPLEVGQSYAIIAKPNSGANLFDGWSGEFTATSKQLSFTMPDLDIALTATFASALINESVIGKFAGNVSRSTASLFDVATSGYFSATIGKTGKFSGKLIYDGVTYAVRGETTAQGQFIGEIPRKKNTPLLLTLSLDTSLVGSKGLSGTVSADGIDSEIFCPKVLTKAEALVATVGLAGSYTFQLPVTDLLDDSKPQGTGVGTLTLDIKGNVRWSGLLSDGTKVGQAAPLSNNKTWPFFLRLYKGRGVMLGTVTMDKTQATTDLAASLNWHKLGDARDKFFPGGFLILDTQMLGSAYVRPVEGQRVLPSFASGNGTLILEEGNFRVPFAAKTVGITDRNKITIAPLGADKLTLGITVSTGAVVGNFIHPVTGKKTKITGVVLQKTERAVGIFEGSTPSSTALQTGRLSITPIVP